MIRTERLARRDAGIGLNALITPGKRAMGFATGVTTNVSGFVRPGNFVDIMVSIAPGIEELETDFITETILQQVKVLAVGSTLEREDDKNKNAQNAAQNSLTVEVTLEEAEKLALAVSKGTIFVVLRSDVDIVQQNVERPTDVGVLIGFDPAKEPVAKAPVIRRSSPKPAATIGAEVISGSKTDRVKFDANGTTKDN
jgi:pilus assembly protein CpaB